MLSNSDVLPLAIEPSPQCQAVVVAGPPKGTTVVLGEVTCRLADLPRWKPTINLDRTIPERNDG